MLFISNIIKLFSFIHVMKYLLAHNLILSYNIFQYRNCQFHPYLQKHQSIHDIIFTFDGGFSMADSILIPLPNISFSYQIRKKTADYVFLIHRNSISSITSLAENCKVSEATITRFCRGLGLPDIMLLNWL